MGDAVLEDFRGKVKKNEPLWPIGYEVCAVFEGI